MAVEESYTVEISGGDVYLSPGMERQAECDTCFAENATEVDLWGLYGSMMSDGPLLTLFMCPVCDDSDDVDIAADIRRAWLEQVESIFCEDDE